MKKSLWSYQGFCPLVAKVDIGIPHKVRAYAKSSKNKEPADEKLGITQRGEAFQTNDRIEPIFFVWNWLCRKKSLLQA